jgi:hypothetical protein
MASRDAPPVVVRFEVQGEPEAPESSVVVEVVVPRPVTLEALAAAFPYQGLYHFRQRVTVKGQRTHCWLDLAEDNATDDLQPPAGKRLDIRALPLSFGEGDGALNIDWGNDDEGPQCSHTAWVDQASKLGRGALESSGRFADQVDSYVDGAARKAAARAQVAAAQAKVGSNAGVLACVRLGRALEGGPRHSLCDRVLRCAHTLLSYCPRSFALLS